MVLPFIHALGQASGDTRLSERDLALYRCYPPTAPNRVTREMARQLGDAAAYARTACRQQGLIHHYKHWCDARDCLPYPPKSFAYYAARPALSLRSRAGEAVAGRNECVRMLRRQAQNPGPGYA